MADSSVLAGIAELGDVLGIDILNPLPTDWMILTDDGSPVISPDTVPKFEFRGEYSLSDYPVEHGSFSSYNKVQRPFEIRMVMVCAGGNYVQAALDALGLNLGQKYMQKSDFIDTLDYMLDTTDLFTIVTPDKTYPSVNMEHYDYKRESRNGATMLIVEAWFRQIMVTGTASYTNVRSASAATPQDQGSVHLGDSVEVSFPPVPAGQLQ